MAIKYLDAKRIRGSSTASGMFDGSDLKAYWQFDEASTSTQNNEINIACMIKQFSSLKRTISY